MPVFVSPGVYVNEKDLSNIVAAVAPSSSALVGYSAKGAIGERVLVTNTKQFIEEYGVPVTGEFFHYTALAFLEKGNQLYCVRVVNGALYGGVIITQTGGSNVGISPGSATPVYQSESGVDVCFYVFGKDPGLWDNNLAVRITNLDGVLYTFDIEVYLKDANGVYNNVESFTVSRKEQLDGYGRQQYLEDRINGFSRYIVVADGAAADTVLPTVQLTNLLFTGGLDGSAISDSHVNVGWDLFGNPDDVDVRILINGGQASVAVQTKMKTIVEARKDCFMVLDVPFASLTSATDIITFRTTTQNFNTSYGALYAGWVTIFDQYNDVTIDVPASGYVAAQYAFNDFVGEPWTAPAGFNRGILNVLSVSNIFTQGERDLLYPDQVNPIQMFRGEGVVIWGQKTLQTKDSALSRVNVRRLLIVMEKSLSIFLRSYAFEPNDDITRFRVTAQIEEYLTILGARGAFQTTAEDRGFLVVCDETNNTPAVIDRNELLVDVYVKPIRTAEFIKLSVVVTATGTSFDELVALGTAI